MKLLIFDIDGTLTHLSGATRRAFDAAFLRLFGVNAVFGEIKMHGRTDPLIFRDCYFQSGLNDDWKAAYTGFRTVYLEELPQKIATSTGARLHPGVRELLEALAARPDDAALALGTGNMEGGGRLKIEHFGLNRFFPVGGFGDHHHVRADIMREAIEKAHVHWNRTFQSAATWVIGDTVLDIEGGKAVGARTLAVATGGAFGKAELAAANPDATLDDLSDTAAVLRVFGLN